jgi:hypothetical protein
MTNFFRNSKIEKPVKNHRCPCDRCGGSGIFYIHGTCYRCGGNGVDPTYRTWAYPAAWTDEQCQAHVDLLNARNAASRDRAAAKRQAKADAIHTANVERCPALARLADYEFRQQFDGFVIDIRSKSFSFALSDRQLDALTRAVEAKEAFLARRAAQKAEAIANAKPVPAGRVEVEGTILSIKEYTLTVGYNTNVTSLKALIQCDGYKLFGTLPASIVEGAKVGDRVSLTATVKEKEAGFGTYSRPTGGEILVPVSA